jgi:23S rRNA pseudouridine1911/1915/1917 synthase
LQRRAARGLPPRENDSEILLNRQALHAAKIEFTHPKTGQSLSIEAPLPEDLQRVLEALEAGE